MPSSKLEFHIAHEADNPTHIFFYKPITVETNTLRVKILDDYKIDFNKLYQFYLNVGGANFSFLAKPLEQKADNVYTFLIKDSWIELRKYPRLKTDSLDIDVSVKGMKGKLADISLGGCKVKFRHPIPRSLFSPPHNRVLVSIYLPGEKEPVNIWAEVVKVDSAEKSVSCEFTHKDERILKLYRRITDLLKGKKKEEILG